MKPKYIIITPVKNEENFLRQTIRSVAGQEVKPDTWFIVDDSSTDATPNIIAQASREYDWIQGIKAQSDGKRRIGGQAALYPTLATVNPRHYDFIIRMDGDLEFGDDVFSRLFCEFEKNPKLGIASGTCFINVKGKHIREKHPQFHTRGPLKIYRSECFSAINGLDENEGWDTLDEIKANQLGWQSQSYPDIRVLHLRKTQTASGALRGFLNQGRVSFYVGYHPFYALCRSVRHFVSKPWGLGGLYMMYGFFEGYARKRPRIQDHGLIHYLRQQQINRMVGRTTIWH
jgi:poly-beta-1,6-N-acetyl-D-glucosamine synthase